MIFADAIADLIESMTVRLPRTWVESTFMRSIQARRVRSRAHPRTAVRECMLVAYGTFGALALALALVWGYAYVPWTTLRVGLSLTVCVLWHSRWPLSWADETPIHSGMWQPIPRTTLLLLSGTQPAMLGARYGESASYSQSGFASRSSCG